MRANDLHACQNCSTAVFPSWRSSWEASRPKAETEGREKQRVRNNVTDEKSPKSSRKWTGVFRSAKMLEGEK